MSSASTIRRVGFRKWYERELMQGHANLVLLLFATLGLLGSVEVYSPKLGLGDQLQIIAAALASAAIGFWAMRRYLYKLNHAEFVAHQAVCGGCQTYAKFDAVDERGADSPLKVCCRRCGHRWEIDL